MENPDGIVRQQFIDRFAPWIDRLCSGERLQPRSSGQVREHDDAGPRQVVNAAHRLSDTLPGDLADRLEEFVDEFWTLCERRWPAAEDPDRVRAAVDVDRLHPIGPDELAGRLDRLARAWRRLERDLSEE